MGLTSRLLSIASIALLYLLGVQVINFFTLKKLGRFPGREDYPFVSILVPARNEERNIEKCINSLLQQDYPNYEIIVLDDESEDRTWEILSRLAQGNDRLHLLKGKPLPEGWIGKCWACHQLSEKARGEFLLLVDADTFHKPSMLRSVMDAAHFYQADLISGLPHEKIETFSELLTIPLISWGILAAIPLPLAFALPHPALSITIGQLLLFKRESYERIGGHISVKDHVCEDMALGRLIKAKGLRWRLVDAGDVTECRMYTNLSEAVNGLSKTIFGALNFRVLLILLFSLLLWLMFCLPPWLLLKSLVNPFPRPLVRQALILVVLSLLSWRVANHRFRVPWYATFLYPVISGLAIFIFLRSMILTVTGKAQWKGRLLAIRRIHW
ncbi:MAG: glycosyltransferase [Firmicutes bacterium]|jgi:chlorobactene glucosyltransferase|nr:glycosyltransferase [Bacillota bacterium]